MSSSESTLRYFAKYVSTIATLLHEDDTFGVETCRSSIIDIFILIVLSLVDLQMIKNARYMY